jgi:hypothetical protein
VVRALHVALSDARHGCEQAVAIAIQGRAFSVFAFVPAAPVRFWFSAISATGWLSAPALGVTPVMN